MGRDVTTGASVLDLDNFSRAVASVYMSSVGRTRFLCSPRFSAVASLAIVPWTQVVSRLSGVP